MLDALRRGTGSWVVKTLLALLIVSFAAWGIGDIFRGGTDPTIAKVGDVNVSTSQFSSAFQRQLRRFQESGSPITSNEARAFGLDRQVLNRLVARVLFDNHSHDLGLSVSEERFSTEIKTNSTFHDAFGNYDKYRLLQVLQVTGVSEKEFIASIKADVRREQLLDLIELVDVVPEAMVDNLYRHKNERRVANLVLLPYESAKIDTPTEDQLEKFHQDNAAQYTAPEYRTASYISLSPEDLMDEVQLGDDEIAVEYETRKAEFVVPERRTIDQILVDDEDAARGMYQRLLGGADFATVAREDAKLSIVDTDLGELTQGEFLTEGLGVAAFAVAKGEVSAPAYSDLGWHIFRAREIVPGTTRTLEDAKDELSKRLRLAHASDALYDFANRLDDELAGGATLEEASQTLSLRFVTAGPFDRDGNDTAGQKDKSLPVVPVFFDTVFAAEEGLDSGLVETPDGKYYVVRVDAIKSAAVRPLDSVRRELTGKWQEEERARVTQKLGESLMEEAKDVEALKRLAGERGYRVRTTAPLLRDGDLVDIALTESQLRTLFSLKPGDMTSGPSRSGNSYVISRLEEVVVPDPAADPEGRSKLKISIADEMPGDLSAQYRDGLESLAGVIIYENAIDAMFGDES
jgi:peptidyl-prolyl cis-trans isomerase D